MRKTNLLLCLLLALFAVNAKAQQSAYTSYTLDGFGISSTISGIESHISQGYDETTAGYLIDNKSNTKYCISYNNDNWEAPVYVDFHSAKPITPIGFAMITADNAAEYANATPSGWVIYAKLNSGDPWTEIERTNISGIDEGNLYEYTHELENDNYQSYQYFRFVITKVNSGGMAQLQDFHFIQEDYPLTIGSTIQWNRFCTAVNNGHDYQGETVSLTADIEVSEMAGFPDNYKPSSPTFSADSKPFRGTFEGNEHTLTFNKGTDEAPFNEKYCAPFRFIEGATIQNLKTEGTIISSEQYCGGLIGVCKAVRNETTTPDVTYYHCNITNCVSDVTIDSRVNGDGCHGGFAGLAAVTAATTGAAAPDPLVIFTGCLFEGELIGTETSSWGGFVGWTMDKIGTTVSQDWNTYAVKAKFMNCVFDPSEISNVKDENNMTFARHNESTLIILRCYSFKEFNGESQGLHAHTISLAAEPYTYGYAERNYDDYGTDTYDLSGILIYYDQTDYDLKLGFEYNNSFYAGEGDQINVLAGAYSGNGFDHWSDGTNTFTDPSFYYSMPAADVTLTAYFVRTQVIIENTAQWNEFCQQLENGEDFSQLTVVLDNDITVSTMAGSSAHPFNSTFNGQGHTLTVTLSGIEEQGVAPFHYISNATIKDLIVDGTVEAASSVSYPHAAGLVGFACNGSTNTIQDCLVHTDVTNNNNDENGNQHIGGIIGHINNSTLNLVGCLYDGTLTSRNYIGGFIGWADNAATIHLNNCVFNGHVTNSANNFHPIGCSSSSLTNNQSTVTNCYYFLTNKIDNKMEDDQAHSIVISTTGKGLEGRALMGANGVSVAMSGNPSNYYIASAIIAYATGIQYGNIFYAGHGEQVNVLLSFNNSGYQLTGYSISWGSLEGTALTGDDDAYVLTVGNQYNPIVMPVTTPTLSTFIFDSQTNSDNNNWNNVENWNQQQLPTSNDNVYILSSVTIPSGCVAAANEITIANDSKITIEDGGQLQHNNAGVEATMQKNITKYTGDKDNYNLMALPFTSYNVAGSPLVTSSETGFAYDLYTFDGTQDKEWRVVDATTGIINNGTGFLYANNMGGIISMTGTLVASNEAVEMTLNYDGTTDFGAWNLVGNPFACNATPNITDFYVIGGENNDEVVATTNGTVAPLAGIFVQASSEVQSVRFTKAETSKAASALTMCLSEASVRSDKLIDRAIVRFDESRGLEKFQLNPNHTRLYIPQGGNDYAVVHSEGVGELPVSFKAEKNGTYTLTSSKDNVEFSYLHLIDNMTGTNIDLLAQPSYSFEASTTDYANRFKLVFATGASSDAESSNFGFVNGMGNFVIFGIDGEATLQVIDMMGHVLSSEQFSGSYKKHLDVAAGIYVLRLINGNDVKAQKIVIR